MSDIICECGHSVDYHRVNGCNHTNDEDTKRWCGCSKQPGTVRHIAAIATLTADRDAWRAALQSLTPGGSEFTEPQECSAWVKSHDRDRWELLKRVKADRDRLAARVAELEAALGKLLADMRLQEFYGFSGELVEFPEIVSNHMNTAGDLLKKD